MKHITLLLITLLVSTNAWALSHCKRNEIDYFSCQLKGSNKVVSFCGSSPVEQDLEVGWVQYRFGKVGKPELVYPKTKAQSKRQFEYHYFSSREAEGSVIDVRFLVNGTYHSFNMSHHYSTDKYHGGIAQEKNHGESVGRECSVVDKKYWGRLMDVPIEQAEESEIGERLDAYFNRSKMKNDIR